MKRLKKIIRKGKTTAFMSEYIRAYYSSSVKKNWILIESKGGKELGSDLLRITEELNQNDLYKEYKIFLTCAKSKRNEFEQIFAVYGLDKTILVEPGSRQYANVLARAKYVFADNPLPSWYAKKEEQKVIYIDHAPLFRKFGRDDNLKAYDMGNPQRNRLMADYLVYGGERMKDISTSAYFLNQMYQGRILCSGYPGNGPLLCGKKKEELLRLYDAEGKTVYGYIPKWFGKLSQENKEGLISRTKKLLEETEAQLKDDELFLVYLQPSFKKEINLSKYTHVKAVTGEYDLKDVLSICDVMITDYSETLFDYLATGKKIVMLENPVLPLAFSDGYLKAEELPFPMVSDEQDLVKELRKGKEYDDSNLRETLCVKEWGDTAAKLCLHIIKGEKQYTEYENDNQDKENVLIYVGGLAKNGLTSAALNLLFSIDRTKRNYIATFRSSAVKSAPNRVALLPEDMGYVPIANMEGKSFIEKIACKLYFEKNNTNPIVVKYVDRFYKRLFERTYGFCKFDYSIHYSGYDKAIINLFQQAHDKNMIFVHSDMVKEIKSKGNQHGPSLKRAYNSYTSVVPVTQDMYAPTFELGKNEKNIKVVYNSHDYISILKKAEMDLKFDEDTVATATEEEMNRILDSSVRKFITIGRFSAEKGHDMLIEAFNKYYKDNKDSYLFIIGGYGPLYESTLKRAKESAAGDHIIIIKSISNPMTILKRCDLFLLSSTYEAMGLVLLEADTLGIPALSTDIKGPRSFMEAHGGYMVNPSVEGLYEGMKAFDRGEVQSMNVDYAAYNQGAIDMFESLFEGDQ